jgi:hypothetical protein
MSVWKHDINEIYFNWFNDIFEYANYVMKYGFFKNVHTCTVNLDLVFW